MDKEKADSVMFPSPQGGSETGMTHEKGAISDWFPSPQGGSETRFSRRLQRLLPTFPSPRGGSETTFACPICNCIYVVSIPSRRVGDEKKWWVKFCQCGVSIPSRRVGDVVAHGFQRGAKTSFHPLKAGRRPRGNEGKGGQKGAKGREGCRRPSVGGKS